MAKSTSPLTLRVTFVDGEFTDYLVDNKSDMAFLIGSITRAINDHKAVKICDKIIMNANNILFVEEL